MMQRFRNIVRNGCVLHVVALIMCTYVVYKIQGGLFKVQDIDYGYAYVQGVSGKHSMTQQTDDGPKDFHANMSFMYDKIELRKLMEKIHTSYYKPATADKCIQRNPHVIIVGVAKCGTRELSDMMAMHPQMVTKGTDGHYQLSGTLFKSSTARKMVKNQMPCTYSDQIGSVKEDFFFTLSDMPANIAALNKRTKIIVMMREPVERVLSQITFTALLKNKSMSNVTLKGFLRADQLTGVLQLNTQSHMIRASVYSVCLKRYLVYFPFEQILIIETKQFSKDPLAIMAEVERFLGVEPFAYEDHLVLNNETGFNCVRETVDATEAVCYSRDRGRGGKTGLTISNTERQVLVDYFRPYNQELFRLINKTYSHWIL